MSETNEHSDIERAARVAEEYDGPGMDSGDDWDQQLGDAAATKHDIAAAIRALAPSPVAEAERRLGDLVDEYIEAFQSLRMSERLNGMRDPAKAARVGEAFKALRRAREEESDE